MGLRCFEVEEAEGKSYEEKSYEEKSYKDSRDTLDMSLNRMSLNDK